MKNILNKKTKKHLYSFAKTYVTVFISIYLTLLGVIDSHSAIMKDINVLDLNIIVISSKGAFISVIRSFYKILTEK